MLHALATNDSSNIDPTRHFTRLVLILSVMIQNMTTTLCINFTCAKKTQKSHQDKTPQITLVLAKHSSNLPCPILLPIFLDVPLHTFIVPVHTLIVLLHASNNTDLKQELGRLVIWKPQALQDFCGRMTHHQAIIPNSYMVLIQLVILSLSTQNFALLM